MNTRAEEEENRLVFWKHEEGFLHKLFRALGHNKVTQAIVAVDLCMHTVRNDAPRCS